MLAPKALSSMLLNDQLPEYWLELASHDLKTCQILNKEKGPQDIIIYHYHQCIEKILKSEILRTSKNIPRIHDLERLFSCLNNPDLSNFVEPIIILNSIALNIRYPQGDQIDANQYNMAKNAFTKLLEALAPQLLK